MDTDGGPNVGVQSHESVGATFLEECGFSQEVSSLQQRTSLITKLGGKLG
jgi:hypothetical protein